MPCLFNKKERKRVIIALRLKIRLQKHICNIWIINHNENANDSMKYDVEKPWSSQSPPIPLLATGLCMLRLSMAKERYIFF